MRRPRPLPLADLVAPVIGPALAARGFTGGDLLASWPEIVGETLARVSRPLRVEWPRRRPGEEGRPEPATLVVRVTGAFALDLQHTAPVIVERINAVYGWRCIGRLALRQGPVGPPLAAKPAAPRASEEARRRIGETVADIGPEPLRLALERLGCALAAQGEGSSS